MTSSNRIDAPLKFLGVTLTLLLPLFLTHGRALAEITMSAIAILFLIKSAHEAQWSWIDQTWVKLAFAWWGWQVFCTLATLNVTGGAGLTQALLSIRIIVFIAALQCWTLQDIWARDGTRWLLVVCTTYIAAQILIQACFGVNLFGIPRAADGTLTGPYNHSRAAAPLSRLIPPVLMLTIAILHARTRAWRCSLAGYLLTVFAIGTLALAGQRMPMVLTLFGVALCALLYKPYRIVGTLSVLCTPAITYGVKLISHRSTDHLVTLAEQQLSQFSQSHYGLIYGRVWAMVSTHPIFGLGYDAFRHACRDPMFFKGIVTLGQPANGGGAAICVQHAHNHYLQMLSNAGWPGLLLFVSLIIAILIALWPRPGRYHAWRVGLFVAFILQEWPIASTSDFINLPLGGWAFFLIGVGLAEAQALRTYTSAHGHDDTQSI